MGFGPLDDNEPTKGASVLLPSVLLYIVAVAFLLKKKIIRTKNICMFYTMPIANCQY